MANLFLPSLPVCPYCNTIYRYGDVRRMIFKKSEICYHCEKSFKISKKKLLILILELLIIYAAADLLIINFIGVTLLVLFIINIVLVIIGIIMIPYYIQFVEVKKGKI